MLEFTAPKPLAQNGKGVSRDGETETRESEGKRTNKIMSGRLLYQHFSQIFLGLASDPNFSSVQRGTRPLPLHSSKPEKKVIREPQRGKASPPLASDLSFSSFVLLSPHEYLSVVMDRSAGAGAGPGLLTVEDLTGGGDRKRKKRRMTSSPYHHLSSTQVCS